MRADVAAFISLMFGTIIVVALVKHYRGTAADINAVGNATHRIVRAYN